MSASVVQLTATTSLGGTNQAINVFHVGCEGIQTTTEVNSLLACFKSFYDTISSFRATGQTTLIGSKVLYWSVSWWTPPTFDGAGRPLTKGHFNTPPVILSGTPVSSTVGSGGVLVPTQLAAVVSWRTAVASKNSRGRTFLGGSGENVMQSNLLVSTAVTAINNAAAALIPAIKGVTSAQGPLELVVWSPTKGHTTEIVAGSTDNIYDTLRSRAK